jgi:hypothetical protein
LGLVDRNVGLRDRNVGLGDPGVGLGDPDVGLSDPDLPGSRSGHHQCPGRFSNRGGLNFSDGLKVGEAWFAETIEFGTLRFVMENPQTLDLEEFRFTGMYGETELDGLFELSLPLERMA